MKYRRTYREPDQLLRRMMASRRHHWDLQLGPGPYGEEGIPFRGGTLICRPVDEEATVCEHCGVTLKELHERGFDQFFFDIRGCPGTRAA